MCQTSFLISFFAIFFWVIPPVLLCLWTDSFSSYLSSHIIIPSRCKTTSTTTTTTAVRSFVRSSSSEKRRESEKRENFESFFFKGQTLR